MLLFQNLEARIYFTGLRGSVEWVFRGRFLLPVKEEMLLSFPVLVSNGCDNKRPQTWGLKTREIYSLITLGDRSSKSHHWVESKVLT